MRLINLSMSGERPAKGAKKKMKTSNQIKAEILKDTAFIIAAKYAVKAAKQKTFADKKFMREVSALFSQIGGAA